MIPIHVVVSGTALDAAARREVAALAQQASQSEQATQQSQVQQAGREAQQAGSEAAQAGRTAREIEAQLGSLRSLHSLHALQAQAAVEGQTAVDIGETKVSVSPDGRTTIVGPDGKTTVIDRSGHVTRISEDGRITRSSAVPGENVIPNDVRELSMMGLLLIAFVIVARPLAGAFGRRLDRRGGSDSDQMRALQGEMNQRMQRIEQAVEAVAIEVERVSEGQRFTTKLLSELRAPATLAAAAPGQYSREK